MREEKEMVHREREREKEIQRECARVSEGRERGERDRQKEEECARV